ncbi:probable flavin-containing monooxygenase 1 [Chenopodium quinoa]|uniref:probable flavin-containing monooxygenase 1 n=1 Tax=Chenopodium quinoa TaxID=63459 RepID=UPI000B77A4EF|nr:probable flavin-containing monooxygenase 1 [Chenopodium quinoa]
MQKKVAIVGAGVSGLLACKYTLSKGHYPIVFEALDISGGVWAKTLERTKLQSPKPLYQFSDFPWPSSLNQLFPTCVQVLDYVNSYAKYFDLLRHIRFSTKVISISYEGPSNEELQSWTLWGGNGDPFGNGGKWLVATQNLYNLSTEVMEVDLVILCVGRFSGVPNVPKYPTNKGPEACESHVIHSMEYSALDYEAARNLVRGKQVTIVGFGKTAMDVAMECVIANGLDNPCTMIYRNVYWNVPDYFLWRSPLAYLYLNRFAEVWVRKPSDGFLIVLLALIFWSLKWAICKVVEGEVKRMHRLEKLGLVPERSLLEEMNACLISTVPQEFYDKVEEGSIVLQKCSRFHFCKEGILLSNNELEPPRLVNNDLVILATGFKGEQKLKHIFSSTKFQDYIMPPNINTLVPLYRECIHPRIPQLAIIGFSDSLANLYSSELKCRWLAELFGGKFKLPSIQDMEEDILTTENLIAKNSENRDSKTCIGALHIWYNDQLCKDMDWNPKRKNGFWAEWFEPYGPMDYTQS